jgi:hypothetical protein
MPGNIKDSPKSKLVKIKCPKCNSEFHLELSDLLKDNQDNPTMEQIKESEAPIKDNDKVMSAFKEALRRYKDK